MKEDKKSNDTNKTENNNKAESILDNIVTVPTQPLFSSNYDQPVLSVDSSGLVRLNQPSSTLSILDFDREKEIVEPYKLINTQPIRSKGLSVANSNSGIVFRDSSPNNVRLSQLNIALPSNDKPFNLISTNPVQIKPFVVPPEEIIKSAVKEALKETLKESLRELKEEERTIVESQTISDIYYEADLPQPVLVAFGKETPIPPNSNMHYLCNVLFKHTNDKKKTWSWDEIVEEWGESAEDYKPRIIHTAGRGVNTKIAMNTTVKDLLIITLKTVQINPKYL